MKYCIKLDGTHGELECHRVCYSTIYFGNGGGMNKTGETFRNESSSIWKDMLLTGDNKNHDHVQLTNDTDTDIEYFSPFGIQLRIDKILTRNFTFKVPS